MRALGARAFWREFLGTSQLRTECTVCMSRLCPSGTKCRDDCWPQQGRSRKTYLSIHRTSPGEERGNWTGKVVFAHGSVEFCEATSIGLADESKESLYGRETDRDLRSAHGMSMRRVIFILFSPNEQRGGDWWVRCQTFFFAFFSFSVDHERDWPPCKVVFSDWQPPNQQDAAEREKQQNAIKRFCLCSL